MTKCIKNVCFVGLLAVAAACGGNGNDVTHSTVDSTELIPEVFVQPDTVLFYSVTEETKQKTRVFTDTITITKPESVINGINSVFNDVQLEYIKTSGDTVYAHIESADAFASDLGSSGAREYLATVVLNLTALDSIHFVNLDFKQGSHAAPGVYSQKEFAGYTEKSE